MRVIKIKAVIFTKGDNYLIHGTNDQSTTEMFNAALPLWDFDPESEDVQIVELMVPLRERESDFDTE